MFPKDLTFASSKQFEQAAAYFCTGGRVGSTGDSKSATYYFKVFDRKISTDIPDSIKKKRYTSTTMKEI